MPNKTSKEITGAFIRDKRQALGWSQSELCRQVYGSDTNKGEVSRIEAGHKSISLDTLDKYLQVLNSEITFKEY